MNADTASALNAINRRFYRTEAAAFSATRDHPWAGWERILERLEARGCGDARALSVLDVGCGNARLAAYLARRLPRPFRYLGLDTTSELLAAARRNPGVPPSASLAQCDLVAGDLAAAIPADADGYDLVAVFGFLHHVPGFTRRAALLQQLGRLLAAGGLLAVAAWRFDAFPRFRAKRVPWDSFNRGSDQPVDVADLEPGDFLLRWGAGDAAVRYCHFLDEDEISRLSEQLLADGSLRLAERFTADGREGDLNDYLVFMASA